MRSLLQQDNVLGKVVTVSAIIALTLYHRVAGIVALIVVISIMQQQQQARINFLQDSIIKDEQTA
jgi:hypothetical protein